MEQLYSALAQYAAVSRILRAEYALAFVSEHLFARNQLEQLPPSAKFAAVSGVAAKQLFRAAREFRRQ